MNKLQKNLNDALTQLVRSQGKHGLREFFDSEAWVGFEKVVIEHIEDGRDMLEVESVFEDVRFMQGYIMGLRTIIDLVDVSAERAQQMLDGMPSAEPTNEDETDERGIEPESVI